MSNTQVNAEKTTQKVGGDLSAEARDPKVRTAAAPRFSLEAGADTRVAQRQSTPEEGVLDGISQYDEFINEASTKFGVPVTQIKAIMAVESGGVATATSGAAYGLMQVTQDTWGDTLDNYPDLRQYSFANWRDPRGNIMVGTATFVLKTRRIGVGQDNPNFASLAVASYNAGEGTIGHAISLARRAGHQDPTAVCLQPEFLKPAIRYTEIYSYYLSNGQASTIDEAVDLKYLEISRYPEKVRTYLEAQSGQSSAPRVNTAGDGNTAAISQGTVTGNDVRVRRGPGTQFNAEATTLSSGSNVSVYQVEGRWLRIGPSRWVHGDYVRQSAVTTPRTQNPSTTRPEAEAAQTGILGQAGNMLSNAVNSVTQSDLLNQAGTLINNIGNAAGNALNSAANTAGNIVTGIGTTLSNLNPFSGQQTSPAAPAARTVAPSNGRNVSITAAVGRGAPNQRQDVIAIQAALLRVGFRVGVDGAFGNETATAITRFQTNALGSSDGRIDPGGRTLARLNATADRAMANLAAAAPISNGSVAINFEANANQGAVLAYARGVISDLVAASGGNSCTITSTARTPADQARAMYQNLSVGTRIAYAAPGAAVTAVFDRSHAAGRNAAQIQQDMVDEIMRQGPGRVSKHCADFNTLCVVDISPGSIQNQSRFIAAVDADSRVSRFLHPGNSDDPAYHIEIPIR